MIAAERKRYNRASDIGCDDCLRMPLCSSVSIHATKSIHEVSRVGGVVVGYLTHYSTLFDIPHTRHRPRDKPFRSSLSIASRVGM